MLVFFLLYLVCSLPDCTGLIASVTNIRTAVEAHECVLGGLVADAELASLSCKRGGGEVVSGCPGAGSDDITGFQRAKTTQRFVGTAYESPMSFERPTMTTPQGSRISIDYSTEPPTEISDSFVLEKDDVFDTPRCIAAGLEDSLVDAWTQLGSPTDKVGFMKFGDAVDRAVLITGGGGWGRR